jgi:glycerol-3-phosphate O-acyltransferase/dihydroxyacetone phosphate acyltransferase
MSRFLPFMEQPLKTGVARIALDAVKLAHEAGDEGFAVHIVPVGLVFTHREKFRSDLCIHYCAPVIVDASMLQGDEKAMVHKITNSVNEAMLGHTINAPTWDIIRLAMTACRLFRPIGTELCLGEYAMALRGWVEVLKQRPEGDRDGDKLLHALRAYQV